MGEKSYPRRFGPPLIDESCFIHGSACIIGDVTIEADCSVWPYAVIRADEAHIRIGRSSNIQDGAVIHVDEGFPTSIGEEVTVGHGAIVHGATVEDRCIIGIRSVLLNGCVIGNGSIVGAGAVVTPGTVIPPHSLVVGIPGAVKRTDPDLEQNAALNSRIYVDKARSYLRGDFGKMALELPLR